MNKFGIHGPNKGFRELEAMLSLGGDNFTILHSERDLLPRIRQARPNAVILVRHYLERWSAVDPVEWARTCAKIAEEVRPHTTHHTLANEQNLPEEGGGISREWFQRINDWNLKSIGEFKRLCPWATTHWPALASGHSEDQDDFGDGTIGYEICRPSIELADVLDHHDYWNTPDQLFGTELSLWYAFRFTKAHELFPQKPIFISEGGWFGHGQASAAAEHYLYFFRRLYEYPYVIGATPFIWDSGPEHGGQIWVGNSRLIDAIREAEKPEVPYPQPLPTGRMVRLFAELADSLVYDLRGELPRREGAKPYPKRKSLNLIQGVVIHWADGSGQDYDTQALARYQTGPKAHLPFPEMAYHFHIRQDGRIFWLLPLEAISWHVGEHNPPYLGLLAQPPKEAIWTEAQIQALRRLIGWLARGIGRRLEVRLHRDLGPTECPGPFGERLLAALEMPREREEVRKEIEETIERLRNLVEELVEEGGS